MVGSGSSISIWEDNWIPAHPLLKPIRPQPEADKNLKVSALLDHQNGGWSFTEVIEKFPEAESNLILEIIPGRWDSNDKRIWLGTKDRRYTVRSDYLFLQAKARWIDRRGSTADI